MLVFTSQLIYALMSFFYWHPLVLLLVWVSKSTVVYSMLVYLISSLVHFYVTLLLKYYLALSPHLYN